MAMFQYFPSILHIPLKNILDFVFTTSYFFYRESDLKHYCQSIKSIEHISPSCRSPLPPSPHLTSSPSAPSPPSSSPTPSAKRPTGPRRLCPLARCKPVIVWTRRCSGHSGLRSSRIGDWGSNGGRGAGGGLEGGRLKDSFFFLSLFRNLYILINRGNGWERRARDYIWNTRSRSWRSLNKIVIIDIC